jgi:serine protease AprX
VLALALVAASLFVVPVAATAPAGRSVAVVDARVLEAKGPTTALVHVRPEFRIADGIAAAGRAGAAIGSSYDAIGVFVAYGSAGMFRDLGRSPSIEGIEANRRLHYDTDTSHEATRGQDVLDGTVTLPGGTIIDGLGVGVAIVDSGVDGTHPDLADRMGGNVKIVCTVTGSQPGADPAVEGNLGQCRGPKVAVPMDDTDSSTGSGHGTHVAGIVAGTGAASDGRYHGAAPGATIYGVSSGTATSVENALDGLNWVLENHDQVTPDIKVVNNSWSVCCGARFRDSQGLDALWDMQDALIAEGVTLVFAAGNDGGDGGTATTSGTCSNPVPGLVCVAGYDDGDTGTRNGIIWSGSSRGKRYPYAGAQQQDTFPHTLTWPDVAAPATGIVSTCRAHMPYACLASKTDPPNSYATATGTSMAAPHIAGIVAQLYQADPELTPADVENVLEDTAYKFLWGSAYGEYPDPTNSDDTTSFEKGHGLVDVVAALNSVLGTGSPDPDPTPSPSPTPTPQPGGTTFYFHSSAPVGNVDDVRTRLREETGWQNLGLGGRTSFSTVAPTKATASTYHPVAGKTTASGREVNPELYPYWTGQITEGVEALDLRFWARGPASYATGEVSYLVSVDVGSRRYNLPIVTRSVPVGSAEATLIEASFRTMIVGGSEVPLDLPAPESDETFTVVIRPSGPNGVGGYIEFDSIDRPSGFTINSGI